MRFLSSTLVNCLPLVFVLRCLFFFLFLFLFFYGLFSPFFVKEWYTHNLYHLQPKPKSIPVPLCTLTHSLLILTKIRFWILKSIHFLRSRERYIITRWVMLMGDNARLSNRFSLSHCIRGFFLVFWFYNDPTNNFYR